MHRLAYHLRCGGRRVTGWQPRPRWSAGGCPAVFEGARDVGGQSHGVRVRYSVASPWPVLAVQDAVRQPLPGLSRCLLTPGGGVAVAEQMGKSDVVQSVTAASHDFDEVMDTWRAWMRRSELALHRAVADRAAPPVAVPDLHERVVVPRTVLSLPLRAPTILPPLDRSVTLGLLLLLGEAGPSVLIEYVECPSPGVSSADFDDMATAFAFLLVLLCGFGALLVHASHSERVPVKRRPGRAVR